jgi:hypothetical protein
MSSLRAMPTRQFVFLKADKPDTSQPIPPQYTMRNDREHDSRKKRLLFAIKRDLQAASTLPRDTSAESLKLVEMLEAVHSSTSTSHTNVTSTAASQLSQSLALIERFIVDQLPQGSVGDSVLAAWNCILAQSVKATPLMRHTRPRVVEQLRCKAEAAYTSSGTSLMVFRADNNSDEQLRISRIEEIVTRGDPRAYSQLQTPRMKKPSPRARFVQHLSHKTSPSFPASIAVKVPGSAASAEKERPDLAESASNSGHFEKLLQILGCGDQRVQTRELNKELDNIRENLKQMKGRVNLMTSQLDVQESSEMLPRPLEPQERYVRHALAAALSRPYPPLLFVLADEMTLIVGAHGCYARNWLEGRHWSGEIIADAIGGAAGTTPPPRCDACPIVPIACVPTKTFLWILTCSPSPDFSARKIECKRAPYCSASSSPRAAAADPGTFGEREREVNLC